MTNQFNFNEFKDATRTTTPRARSKRPMVTLAKSAGNGVYTLSFNTESQKKIVEFMYAKLVISSALQIVGLEFYKEKPTDQSVKVTRSALFGGTRTIMSANGLGEYLAQSSRVKMYFTKYNYRFELKPNGDSDSEFYFELNKAIKRVKPRR